MLFCFFLFVFVCFFLNLSDVTLSILSLLLLNYICIFQVSFLSLKRALDLMRTFKFRILIKKKNKSE